MCKPGHIMVIKEGDVVSENNYRSLPSQQQKREFDQTVKDVEKLFYNSVQSRIPQEEMCS